jgi:hypothetical protein
LSEVSSDDIYYSGTVLAGLGTGLLSTAAISLSPTLNDLPLAGAEVVRIAFRLGVLVDRVSEHLQPRAPADSGPGDSWAYVVPDVSADEVQRELEAIHTKEVSMKSLRVYSEMECFVTLCSYRSCMNWRTIPRNDTCPSLTHIEILENTRGEQGLPQCYKPNFSNDQWPTSKTEAHLSQVGLLPGPTIHRSASICGVVPCKSCLQRGARQEHHPD